ncbi:glutathione S-transferase family protein [Paraburkholderia caffeinilytica]|uniref:GST C-terminal domain-containing protein n=1 Tax=Paraburkholderia caffeinilytica TaxID=1761016 RepID=A0ABQ1MM93_9BURK|nr:hypothetical protein GCM10011400_29620 [Paraburkholderia caffeinilytica]
MADHGALHRRIDDESPPDAARHLRRGDTTFPSWCLKNTGARLLAQAERFLIDAPYIASNRFTLADIAAYTSAFAMRQDLDWSALPLLRAWYARISARPGVVRGLAAF